MTTARSPSNSVIVRTLPRNIRGLRLHGREQSLVSVKNTSEHFLGIQEDWTVQSGRYQGARFSMLEGRAFCVVGAPVRVRASRQTRLLFVRFAAVHESLSGGCFEAVRTEFPPRPTRG